MRRKIVFFVFFSFIISIFFPLFLLMYFQYLGFAAPIKANIVIDAKKIIGPVPTRWKALAQGGEEQGKRMLANVIPQIAALYPRYIRIDHIYDFYDVANRDSAGNLILNWSKLDETVCDIYHTGAKPFFSLGYMPSVMSTDGSLISEPRDWGEWAYLVQKTVERYSGKGTRLCGQVGDFWLTDIYYEVWNEPDLESFGSWTNRADGKSYLKLYQYAATGAQSAQNVHTFFLGGPATASLYRNWIVNFVEFARINNLRLDFISWHRYSPDVSGFSRQIGDLNIWLSDERFKNYRLIPRILSEWGYDSNPNPIADSNIGTAHTIASIRNFFEQNIEMAFLFDIKDGPEPRWGILTNEGSEKSRYKALQLLNLLEGDELFVDGEGTFVSALASTDSHSTRLLLVNYDPNNSNTELVPVQFLNLPVGSYTMNTKYVDGRTIPVRNIPVQNGELQRSILMPPNSVVAVDLARE